MRNWTTLFVFVIALYASIHLSVLVNPDTSSSYSDVESLAGILLLIVGTIWIIAYFRTSSKLRNALAENWSKLTLNGGVAIKRMLGYTAIGAIIGVAIGYALYTLSRVPLVAPINIWLFDERMGNPLDAMIWSAFGAVVGGVVSYLRGIVSR